MHAARTEPLPEYDAWRVDLSHPLLRGAASRPEAMVAAASLICASAARYEHTGRGPDTFDEFGLVRACVQAAHDWATEGGRAEPVADFTGYGADQNRSTTKDVQDLLNAWGLVCVETAGAGSLARKARAGDVALHIGRGPTLGVIVAAGRETDHYPHFELPAMATVWAPAPPRVDRKATLSHHAVGLFRFPDQRARRAGAADGQPRGARVALETA